MRRGSLIDQGVVFCYAVPATVALIVIGKAIMVLRILLGGG